MRSVSSRTISASASRKLRLMAAAICASLEPESRSACSSASGSQIKPILIKKKQSKQIKIKKKCRNVYLPTTQTPSNRTTNTSSRTTYSPRSPHYKPPNQPK
jgi:hypothetical protein